VNAVSQDRVAMAQAADRCEQALNTIDSIRDKILTSKDELRATWAGNTALTFDSVVNTYDEKLKKILDTLNNLIEKLGKQKIHYENIEQGNNQSISKFDSLLNGGT
jgi:WXG100 family type VII secretion target